MSTTAIVVAVPASVAFPLLLLWVIGRAVTAVASRTPADAGRPRQYLAGRLYGVQVIAIVTCDDELLVSLAVQGAGEIPGAFRISAGEWPLARVERWRGADAAQVTIDATMECEGGGKPVCVAPMVHRAARQDQGPAAQ